MAVKSQEGYEKVLKFLKRDEKVKITFCEQLVNFFKKYPFHCILDHWQRVKKNVSVFCTSSKYKGCQSGDLTLGNSHEWQRENFSLHYQFNIKQKSDENKEKYQLRESLVDPIPNSPN